jgi:dTMP kinase
MFVCLEGIDGAGKSTQARLLHDALAAAGVSVELVRDPGTTPLGKTIRQILLDYDEPISAAAQMLLFSAARSELSQHIQQQITADKVIICDRWILSTLVYQTSLNTLDPELVIQIFNGTSILPDLCVLLDLDPEVADARKAHESRKDRYERVGLDEKVRMRAAYRRYARAYQCAHSTIILDANLAQEALHDRILSIVSRCRPEVTAK